MYEPYYGLTDRPFELTANPRFLLLTPTHREALNTLDYGITARKGITLLIGEAGTGKTTIVRKALALKHAAGSGGTTADWFVYLNNPRLTRSEFLQLLAARFELGAEAAGSKAEFLHALEMTLRDRAEHRVLTVLLIDEAQSLPDELLEEVRLLTNIETDDDKLLQLVLSGQPELADRLNQPGLRQLKQRVALRCRLAPLTLRETAAYIAGRLRLAGGDAGRIFTRDAIVAVHLASAGVPRTVSVVCDNALLAGYAADECPVGAETVRSACRDLDLATNPRPVAAPWGRHASTAITGAAVPDGLESCEVTSVSQRGWQRP